MPDYTGGNNRNNGRYGGGFQNRGQFEQPVKIDAMRLPDNYVDEAEKVINGLQGKPITNTKLRKLFNLFSDTFNEAKRSKEDLLNERQKQALLTARVRMLYESGREPETKEFIRQSKLLNYLKSVGDSRKALVDYYGYFEALVAYHRFRFVEK